MNGTEWWRAAEMQEGLLDHFARPMLAMQLLVPGDGAPQHCTFSGVLVHYNGLSIWLTAGHVISRINEIAEAFPGQVRAAWADDHPLPDAAMMPVDLNGLTRLELDSKGLDLGFAFLDPYTVRLIRGNPKRMFLGPENWSDEGLVAPEVFFLVGYPVEASSLRRMTPSPDGCTVSIRTGLTCLPVLPIGRDPAAPEEFWNHPGDFFGRLVDFEHLGDQIKSIVGMSGGPLFAVAQTSEGIHCRFAGLQSSWLESRALIRAVAADQVEGVMEVVYTRIRNTSSDPAH